MSRSIEAFYLRRYVEARERRCASLTGRGPHSGKPQSLADMLGGFHRLFSWGPFRPEPSWEYYPRKTLSQPVRLPVLWLGYLFVGPARSRCSFKPTHDPRHNLSQTPTSWVAMLLVPI
ncbi:hypothetical protein GW17_00022281 [Ensete ventricosum]|nr:hypothetical protein GW17_00022281 [Ensete ventricosum]